jgi:hypothetical protein
VGSEGTVLLAGVLQGWGLRRWDVAWFGCIEVGVEPGWSTTSHWPRDAARNAHVRWGMVGVCVLARSAATRWET